MHTTASEIVKHLRGEGGYVSGEAIAGRIGISRAAVWKHISSLRRKGFKISSVTNRGYRLDSVPDLPSREVLDSILNTRRFGRNMEYHRIIDSTNARAMAMGHEGAAEGTLVTADRQTKGRGRLGGKWSSPAGKNLYMSIVLTPDASVDLLFQIERTALTALWKTVAEACPGLPLEMLETGLFSSGRKIGGVLCEVCGEIGRIHHAVVGIGLNISHDPGDRTASSILKLTGRAPSRAELTAKVLEEMELQYEKWLKIEKS